MVVDGDPCGRRWWRSERWLPALLACDSSYKLVLLDEGMMADPILQSEGDGNGQWWRSTES
jgi:hypothetical protein